MRFTTIVDRQTIAHHNRASRLPALWLAALCTLCMTAPAVADHASDVRYVTLQPTFVTNYGHSATGRLKYLKADVTVRVDSQAAEMAVRTHLPYLRNNLVLLFSRQDEATLSSSAGREQLRQEALKEVRDVLEQEEGKPYVEDLMFSNFIVQH